jgi:hypothetical protein
MRITSLLFLSLASLAMGEPLFKSVGKRQVSNFVTALHCTVTNRISSTGIVGKSCLYATVLTIRADQRSLQLE